MDLSFDIKDTPIKACEHTDELAIYCPPPHNLAFCNDCFFDKNEQQKYGKGMTLKKAAAEQISRLEHIRLQVNEALDSCNEMQNSVLNSEGLEDEVLKKVNRQFDQLKAIIDQQKLEAHNTIKNLESVQEYRPPPQDFTNGTLNDLRGFNTEVERLIEKQKMMSGSHNYYSVLQEQHLLRDLLQRHTEYTNKMRSHNAYI